MLCNIFAVYTMKKGIKFYHWQKKAHLSFPSQNIDFYNKVPRGLPLWVCLQLPLCVILPKHHLWHLLQLPVILLLLSDGELIFLIPDHKTNHKCLSEGNAKPFGNLVTPTCVHSGGFFVEIRLSNNSNLFATSKELLHYKSCMPY